MARLQQGRARNRQIDTVQSDPIDNIDGNGIDAADFGEAKTSIPSKPSFPLFIFSLAILKDVLDFAQLTIIGIILSWAVTIVFAIIALFWCMGKAGFLKKRFVIKPLVSMVTVGLLPVLGFLPEASVFVLWMHYRETKYVGDILKSLENIQQNKALREYKVAYAAYKTYKTVQKEIKYAKSIYDVATGESTVGQEAGKRMGTKTASHVASRYYQS